MTDVNQADLSSSGTQTKTISIRGRGFRFILVGIWNTIFGYGLFFCLDTLFAYIIRPDYLAYMSAMVVSQVISILNAYLFHKIVTFRSAVGGWGMVAEFFRFSTTYALTFGISLVLLPLLVEIFHLIPKVAGLIITLVCAGLSYVGHSRFSFSAKASD